MYCQPITINPPLLLGETFEVLIDNQPYLPNPITNNFTICNLALGIHIVKTRRVKASGEKCNWEEKSFLVPQGNFNAIEGINLQITDISVAGNYPYTILSGAFPGTLSGIINTPNSYSYDVETNGVGQIVVKLNGTLVYTSATLSGPSVTNTGIIPMSNGDEIQFSTI